MKTSKMDGSKWQSKIVIWNRPFWQSLKFAPSPLAHFFECLIKATQTPTSVNASKAIEIYDL